MNAGKLTFVHLSDIHFVDGFSDRSAFDLDNPIRKAILEDTRELRHRLPPVAGVLITGDIAYAGKPDEYRIARRWIGELTGLLECPPQKVWCVPGNHDVDWSILKELSPVETLHRELRGCDSLDQVLRKHLENKSGGGLLFAPLKAYIDEFAAQFNCLTCPEKPWWHDDIPLNDGSVLRLRGLNSVMVSDPADNKNENKLILGSAQTQYGREDGVEYLTLCHHPPDWLVDGEDTQEALLAYSKIQLFGHKHKQTTAVIDDTMWLVAGAVHPARGDSDWVPRYNYLAVEVCGSGSDRFLSVDLYPRVWLQTERKFVRDLGSFCGEFKNYRLRLRGSFTQVSVPHTDVSLPEPSEGPTTEVKAEPANMSPSRKALLYHFLRLPHHIRWRIMQSFGLVNEGDQMRPDTRVFLECFDRARARGVLEQVWEAIRKTQSPE